MNGKNYFLTKQQEKYIINLEKRYYESISNNNFCTTNRKIGLEIEFSIVDNDFNLKPETADIITNEVDERFIIQELGSYQIEVNPPPLILDNTAFNALYTTTKEKVKKIIDIANNYNLKIMPVGLPFKIDYKVLQNDNIFSKKHRYQVSANYFNTKNRKGSLLAFNNNDNVLIPGNAGVTIINELHIHLQALDVKDILNLFNYSQMLTAPFIALGANSGITNNKNLKNKEHQIKIFEQSEGLYDGFKKVPRVGLFPGYIESIDDFFNIALSFKPLYFPNNGSAETAFQLALGKYFGWVRIRYEKEPSPNLRIEFRPLSTQPTLKENIALSEFFIKTLLFYVSNNECLLPENYLRKNFDNALKYGMNADLYWSFGKAVSKTPICEILEYISSCVELEKISECLQQRILQKQSPTEKIIKTKKKYGYLSTIKKYMNTFYRETG